MKKSELKTIIKEVILTESKYDSITPMEAVCLYERRFYNQGYGHKFPKAVTDSLKKKGFLKTISTLTSEGWDAVKTDEVREKVKQGAAEIKKNGGVTINLSFLDIRPIY